MLRQRTCTILITLLLTTSNDCLFASSSPHTTDTTFKSSLFSTQSTITSTCIIVIGATFIGYKVFRSYWRRFEENQVNARIILQEAIEERIKFKNGAQPTQFKHSGSRAQRAAQQICTFWITGLISIRHPKLCSLVTKLIEQIKELPGSVETEQSSGTTKSISIYDGALCELKAEIDETKNSIEKAITRRTFKELLYLYWELVCDELWGNTDLSQLDANKLRK